MQVDAAPTALEAPTEYPAPARADVRQKLRVARRHIGEARCWCVHWLRVVLIWALVVCARVAPGLAIRIARAGANIAAISPIGRRMRAEAEWFDMHAREAETWVRRRCWIRCRNIVDLALLATRPDELSRWTVRDEGGERVREAVRAGRPIVVAFPHVGMGGLAPVAAHLGARRGVVAFWSLPRTRVHGWSVEDRLLQGLMVRGLARATTDVMMTGASAARSLRTVLEQPGGVVAVAVDVFWGPGAMHQRPFMGLPTWSFHPGPARLARLARCPIVLCVPIRTGDRELTVHWGPFIEPPDRRNRECDAAVTGALISHLEHVLSEQGSDQYTYPMTCERGRRWSRETRAWM